LFSGFDSNKKRDKSRKDPSIGSPSGELRTPPMTGAFTHGQDPRDMGGVTIQEYSRNQKIPEPEAWRQLRRGELVGRTFEGRLYVFTNVQDPLPVNIESQLSPAINELIAHEQEENLLSYRLDRHDFPVTKESETSQELEMEKILAGTDELVHATLSAQFSASSLPPLPSDEPEILKDSERTFHGASSSPQVLPVATERVTNTELALLLDHLSLAKEENREILKMTQESIRKVTELTDTIVEMKDTVIDAKETQIMFLKDQLETREKEIRKLMQQKEDLEILAQTIMATQHHEKSN
jgi:hypothetical protein